MRSSSYHMTMKLEHFGSGTQLGYHSKPPISYLLGDKYLTNMSSIQVSSSSICDNLVAIIVRDHARFSERDGPLQIEQTTFFLVAWLPF